MIKNPAADSGDKRDAGLIPRWGKSFREGHATHSSVLAWRISWTEEPGRLQSTGLQRVKHDWTDLRCTRSSYLNCVSRARRTRSPGSLSEIKSQILPRPAESEFICILTRYQVSHWSLKNSFRDSICVVRDIIFINYLGGVILQETGSNKNSCPLSWLFGPVSLANFRTFALLSCI